MHRRLDWFLLTWIGYWLALFAATHIPLPPPGEISEPHVPWDKFVHFGGYFVLTLLALLCLSRSRWLQWTHYAGVFLLFASYGMIDELTQSFVPRRECDFWDWVADIAGAGLAIFLFFIGSRLKRSKGNAASDVPTESEDN
jgi:VanZ family protein